MDYGTAVELGSTEPREQANLLKPIRDNIRRARQHRKQFEPGWEMNLAYASGKHWIVMDPNTRTLRRIQQLDPRYQNKELYSADLINEYRTTALGELGSDDDRPELLTLGEDITSEEFQRQANKAVGFGWDNEWDGDSTLQEVDRMIVDLGTAAMRCRFDPTMGPTRSDNVPYKDGRPLTSDAYDQVSQAVSNGQTAQEAGISYSRVPTGRICWEPLSPLNLLPPPAIVHERNFPFDCVVRPVYLPKVKDQYGRNAEDLRPDGDIKSDRKSTRLNSSH